MKINLLNFNIVIGFINYLYIEFDEKFYMLNKYNLILGVFGFLVFILLIMFF